MILSPKGTHPRVRYGECPHPAHLCTTYRS